MSRRDIKKKRKDLKGRMSEKVGRKEDRVEGRADLKDRYQRQPQGRISRIGDKERRKY